MFELLAGYCLAKGFKCLGDKHVLLAAGRDGHVGIVRRLLREEGDEARLVGLLQLMYQWNHVEVGGREIHTTSQPHPFPSSFP